MYSTRENEGSDYRYWFKRYKQYIDLLYMFKYKDEPDNLSR